MSLRDDIVIATRARLYGPNADSDAERIADGVLAVVGERLLSNEAAEAAWCGMDGFLHRAGACRADAADVLAAAWNAVCDTTRNEEQA